MVVLLKYSVVGNQSSGSNCVKLEISQAIITQTIEFKTNFYFLYVLFTFPFIYN